MKALRHWKQHFDASAELVFMRNMTLNGVKVARGSVVSEEVKEAIGEHRLKVWWNGRIIALAEQKPEAVKAPKPEAAKAPKLKKPKPENKPKLPVLGE